MTTHGCSFTAQHLSCRDTHPEASFPLQDSESPKEAKTFNPEATLSLEGTVNLEDILYLGASGDFEERERETEQLEQREVELEAGGWGGIDLPCHLRPW